MIKNHFKIAWRNLWRHKRMTFINIAGLGIGMAATVLIVIWVQNELSFDSYQPDAESIYRITSNITITKTETWKWESSQYILGTHAGNEIPDVLDVGRLQPHYGELNLHRGTQIITEKQVGYIDDRWFSMFHYNFIQGSADDFFKNPFSLILTESTAKKYFGNSDAIGQILRIDTNNYEVRAIIKDNPANSSFQFNLFIPASVLFLDPQSKKDQLAWGDYNFITFLKLRQGTKTAALADKLTSILRTNRKGDKGNSKYSLTGLKDMHFENDVAQSSLVHGNKLIVNIFMVLACLLLATACINYVNLTTARASLRSKEVSVRKIVGAGRVHLFGQFMSESILVSVISLLVAVVLIEIAMPWFRAFTTKDFGNPLDAPVAWIILMATLLMSFLLNGLYPAFLLSSFEPLNVFRGKSMLSFKDSALRRVLVVTQFTISVVLIAGTLVIYRQLNYMEKIDPGYNRSQVFSFDFPWWTIPHFNFDKSAELMKTVKQDLQTQSVTSNVAMASDGFVDFKSSTSGNFDWPGRPKDFEPSFASLSVDADFQRLMQLKLSEGRWFNNDIADRHNVLLNESAVKLIDLHGDPVGQRFINHNDTGVIIGVVKDFHYRSLHDKIGPMIISQRGPGGFYIKTASGNNAAAIAAAGKIWKKYFPDSPFEYAFLDDTYNNLYAAEQQQSVLITLFALIAIFISALGLLGLAAFAAEQKEKEIGIRKVLGASVRNIVRLLSVDFVKMVIIASIVALPIAYWAMNKWLQDFAYRISLSWWIFAGAAGIALLIALVTISFQAIKAAVANPVESLRSE